MSAHTAVSIYVPDQPTRTTEAARLRRIRQQARASEAVVSLLCDLAFGPHPDLGWPPTVTMHHGREACAYA